MVSKQKTVNKKIGKTELKLIPRKTNNPNKFKSVEVFMIKKNAEEIIAEIKNYGHLLDTDDPSVKYVYEQSVKLVGAVHSLINKVVDKKNH